MLFKTALQRLKKTDNKLRTHVGVVVQRYSEMFDRERVDYSIGSILYKVLEEYDFPDRQSFDEAFHTISFYNEDIALMLLKAYNDLRSSFRKLNSSALDEEETVKAFDDFDKASLKYAEVEEKADRFLEREAERVLSGRREYREKWDFSYR